MQMEEHQHEDVILKRIGLEERNEIRFVFNIDAGEGQKNDDDVLEE